MRFDLLTTGLILGLAGLWAYRAFRWRRTAKRAPTPGMAIGRYLAMTALVVQVALLGYAWAAGGGDGYMLPFIFAPATGISLIYLLATLF